jgi:hypothetical protein
MTATISSSTDRRAALKKLIADKKRAIKEKLKEARSKAFWRMWKDPVAWNDDGGWEDSL